ncbi:MAG TPA: EamA family transporter [Bacteroidia bacterium]|nr:EamA family transporter [Bacteroidia bacterium]
MKTKAYIALAALCFFWGTTYLAIRVGIQTIPLFIFSGFRFVCAGLIMCLYFIIRGHSLPGWKDFRTLMISGMLLFVGGNLILCYAEIEIPSGLAALICAAFPFWIVLINYIINRNDKPSRKVMTGLLLGFAGLVIIFRDNLPHLSNPTYLASILLLISANIFWAIGAVYSKRNPVKINLLFGAGLQMLCCGAVSAAVGVFKGELSQLILTQEGVFSFLYLVVAGSIIGYNCFVYSLQELPSTLVSIYAYINPIIAIILGWIVLDEIITASMMIAMVMTLAGVYIVNRSIQENKT